MNTEPNHLSVEYITKERKQITQILLETLQSLGAYQSLDPGAKNHIIKIFSDRIHNYFWNDILFPRELDSTKALNPMLFVRRVESWKKSLGTALDAHVVTLLDKHSWFSSGDVDKTIDEQSNAAYVRMREKRVNMVNESKVSPPSNS